ASGSPREPDKNLRFSDLQHLSQYKSRFAGSWGRKRDSVTAFRCDLLIKHERFCSLEWVLTRLRGHIARCAQGVEDAQSTAALSRGVPEADGLARLSWAWIS
ncbi:MAG: hypothetical protein KAX88_03805, partial [Rhodoferax sp.]|nr:hypothetical protein [Rhodoferax sp.]